MEFFDKIFGQNEGWVPLMRLDSQDKLRITKWFEWPRQKFQIAQYIDQYAGEDVYFSPMLYTEPGSKADPSHTAKKNVVSCRVVWADADEAPPSVFKLAPSIYVETSPKRYHTYWVLDGGVEPKLCEELAHSISETHREDGVDRGWALSKRLRVPGTMNTKHGGAFMVDATITNKTYGVDEFAAVYEPIERTEVSDADIPNVPQDPVTLFNEIPYNGYMNKLFYEQSEDRSTALHTLEMMLFEQGCDANTVFGIVRGAACNKFADPGREESELWRHVLTAEAKHKDNLAKIGQDSAKESESEVSAPAVEEDSSDQGWENISFLSEAEQKMLKRTFIEEYADWGKARSARSARQYHEAAAWSILSTVFSEFAHAVPSWGNVPLNLFFLVLGSTTRSRKSTSKNLMLRVLDALCEDEDDFEYDLGSDATPEALTEVLSERPGRSSIFYVDEVQAFFKHAASGGYTAGILTTLNDIYDGYTKGVMRRTGTKKRTKRARVNLTFYGMGILTQVAQALTDDDFYSGFLPRVMWVIDLEGDREYGSFDVGQRLEETEKANDPVFDSMVRRLEEARQFWHTWKNNAGGGLASYGLPADEEAWKRWQQFTADLERAADRHPTRSEVLSPSAQRLGTSTLKMACLLAMLDKKIKVEMEHVLTAIHYASKWAFYMEYMSRQVAKSKLLQDAEDLLQMLLASTKPVTYGQALKHFRGKKSVKEFNDLIEYMNHTGMVLIHSTKTGKKTLTAR